MATCEREIKHAYVGKVDGVEQVLLPTNIRYMIVETGGILGRIKSLGRRREADIFEFPLVAFEGGKQNRPYYIDAVSKGGERKHLEIKARAVKTGTRQAAEGGGISDVYRIDVEKVLDADSRLGPLRRKKRVLEATEENMKTLQEYNFAPI